MPVRPPSEMPRYFYQGTSESRWDTIEIQGLIPRIKTNVQPAYGDQTSSARESNPNYVYLAGNPDAKTRFAAHDAARLDKSSPVILKIDSRGMDIENLRPDEDSNAKNWQDSLSIMNSIGYEGEIDPEFVTLYKTFANGKWQDHIIVPSKPDWLAQQINGTGYKPIPDSTATYKWVNQK